LKEPRFFDVGPAGEVGECFTDVKTGGISEKHKRQLLKFAELMEPPYTLNLEVTRKFKRHLWEPPSLYLIYKVCKYHKLLKRTFPQYIIDGVRNIWIVKPSYNARGFGIYLIDSMKEIMQNGRKGQQKIVQKYIERPYLLKIPVGNSLPEDSSSLQKSGANFAPVADTPNF
jgi:hypothetical protein